jgi:DNA-binding transcriptional ArsR family regulator
MTAEILAETLTFVAMSQKLIMNTLIAHVKVTNINVMENPVVAASLLADPTRVGVVNALSEGPLRASELARRTGVTSAALSRHLNLLREGGFIERFDVDDDGRGRAYRLCPSALDGLTAWLRKTSWSAVLADASSQPQISERLGRIGGFLDAFTDRDVSFFERHLRSDALLLFPGMAMPVDKQGTLDSVNSHPPYRRHSVIGEPLIRFIGTSTTVLTLTAEVATDADEEARPTFITVVMEETDPWQLVLLQWTPAAQ